MEPLTLAALISGGSALLGQGISGIGAGIAGGKKAEQDRLAELRRQFEREQELGMQQRNFDRGANMQGLDFLAQLRNQAVANNRMAMFRDKAIKTLGR